MNLNFTLDTDKRIQLYENEAIRYTQLAVEAKDENSRKHWSKRALEWMERVRQLKG